MRTDIDTLQRIRRARLDLRKTQLPGAAPSRGTSGRDSASIDSASGNATLIPPSLAESNEPAEQEVVTHHTINIGGKEIAYTATVGTILLRDKDDKPAAEVTYFAYTKDGGEKDPNRPVTFAYNGGPGSSSVWLHLGGIGPRRVVAGDGAFTPPPPYTIKDNEFSILDKTDLVFIDPVGTGYSRALGEASGKAFWGVDQDAESIADMIRQYVNKNNRWNSPKFILGESYGTIRSAVLANKLQEDGIQLNGVILVSALLNFQTFMTTKSNDLPYQFSLPSFAAVAWYHNRLPDQTQKLPLPTLLKEVERFAEGPYAKALAKGDRLSSRAENAVLDKLALYTGLDRNLWKKANFRITGKVFEKQLLAESNEMVGRLDGRYKGYALEPLLPSTESEYNAEAEAVTPAFNGAINHYMQTELNYRTRRPYNFYPPLWADWDWSRKQDAPLPVGGTTYSRSPKFLNFAPELARAMTTNPYLRVMFNSGIYDLGFPYQATNYTINHMGLTKPLRSHIETKVYAAGHMIYINEASLKQLHDNIGKFIESVLKRQNFPLAE